MCVCVCVCVFVCVWVLRWEALYVGSVPLVDDNGLTRAFAGAR